MLMRYLLITSAFLLLAKGDAYDELILNLFKLRSKAPIMSLNVTFAKPINNTRTKICNCTWAFLTHLNKTMEYVTSGYSVNDKPTVVKITKNIKHLLRESAHKEKGHCPGRKPHSQSLSFILRNSIKYLQDRNEKKC